MEVAERADANPHNVVGQGGSLYWTLSLHLESDRLLSQTPRLHARLGGDLVEEAGSSYAQSCVRRQRDNQLRLSRSYGTEVDNALSLQLRNAIEPMFEDVADREHLGVVEDYLLAIAATPKSTEATDSRPVTLLLDGDIGWETEGRTYAARFADQARTRLDANLRRLWYVHSDCSISYHLSFAIDRYEHRPEHFFLISMLQKLAAPKEFTLGSLASDRIGIVGASPSLLPFRAVRLSDGSSGEQGPLWQQVARLFEKDFADLYNGLVGAPLGSAGEPSPDPWTDVLRHEPYVAVPGLVMPAARSMFYFADRRLRDLLLPRKRNGTPLSRLELVREEFFDRDLKGFLAGLENEKPIMLDHRVWDWLDNHGTGAIHTEGPKFAGIDLNEPGSSSLALCLLFLAGFNQNVIDFLNQDASEVLDSLDPVYPSREEDMKEGFFARFANPNSLISYVGSMRSLESGRRYIGTCPYAFLIHVLTMHNEFLARGFERRSDGTVRAVRRDISNKDWTAALDKISDFRLREQERYLLHHSHNVFRYDTERLVFEALQKIRGLDLKHEKAENVFEAAKSTIRDVEAKKTAKYESTIRTLLAGIGLLATSQALFNWSNCVQTTLPNGGTCPLGSLMLELDWLHPERAISTLGVLLLIAFIVCVLVLAVYLVTALPSLGRKLWRWPSSRRTQAGSEGE